MKNTLKQNRWQADAVHLLPVGLLFLGLGCSGNMGCGEIKCGDNTEPKLKNDGSVECVLKKEEKTASSDPAPAAPTISQPNLQQPTTASES